MGGSKPMAEMPDLTTLHAKIGQLALMRRIDALDLAHPFAGVRMLRDLLQRDGHAIGRQHVATLMRRMGSETVYLKLHTS